MDAFTIGLLGALGVIVAATLLALLATRAALRGAPARRRRAARFGPLAWSLLALAVPASLMGAFGALPSWSYGAGVAVIVLGVLPGTLYLNSRLEPVRGRV